MVYLSESGGGGVAHFPFSQLVLGLGLLTPHASLFIPLVENSP